MRKLTIIESPFTGDRELNQRYLQAALRDSLLRLESPFASHGLYTLPGVLNDDDMDERITGIQAGFAWHDKAEILAVYTDLGVSSGMLEGIKNAKRIGLTIEMRTLPEWGK